VTQRASKLFSLFVVLLDYIDQLEIQGKGTGGANRFVKVEL
jgi:hypothetical protein